MQIMRGSIVEETEKERETTMNAASGGVVSRNPGSFRKEGLTRLRLPKKHSLALGEFASAGTSSATVQLWTWTRLNNINFWKSTKSGRVEK